MSYQTFFPDFKPSDIPPLPEGFSDISSRHSACPVFRRGSQILYVDSSEHALREGGGAPRFSLQDPNGEILLDSDHWPAVLGVLARIEMRGILEEYLAGEIAYNWGEFDIDAVMAEEAEPAINAGITMLTEQDAETAIREMFGRLQDAVGHSNGDWAGIFFDPDKHATMHRLLGEIAAGAN